MNRKNEISLFSTTYRDNKYLKLSDITYNKLLYIIGNCHVLLNYCSKMKMTMRLHVSDY